MLQIENPITEFQRGACAVALNKMFNQSTYFDICIVQSVAKVLNREWALSGPDYAALRALHCCHWADMGTAMSRETRHKSLELLGLDIPILEEVYSGAAPKTSKSWLKLLTRG